MERIGSSRMGVMTDHLVTLSGDGLMTPPARTHSWAAVGRAPNPGGIKGLRGEVAVGHNPLVSIALSRRKKIFPRGQLPRAERDGEHDYPLASGIVQFLEDNRACPGV